MNPKCLKTSLATLLVLGTLTSCSHAPTAAGSFRKMASLGPEGSNQGFGPIPGASIAQLSCPNPEDAANCQTASSAQVQTELDQFEANSAARIAVVPTLMEPLKTTAQALRQKLNGHPANSAFFKLYTSAAERLESAAQGAHPDFSMIKDFQPNAPIIAALENLQSLAKSYEQKIAAQTDPVTIDALKVARNKALQDPTKKVAELSAAYAGDAQVMTAPADRILLAQMDDKSNPAFNTANSYISIAPSCKVDEVFVLGLLGLYRSVQEKYGFEDEQHFLTLLDDSDVLAKALDGPAQFKINCPEKSSLFKDIHLSYDRANNTLTNEFYYSGNSFSGYAPVPAAYLGDLLNFMRSNVK